MLGDWGKGLTGIGPGYWCCHDVPYFLRLYTLLDAFNALMFPL